MKGIFKRFIKKDPYGRVLSTTTERLVDNGAGQIAVNVCETVVRCSSCNRPIGDAGELRGICHYCLSNSCCVHCETHCAVCSRRLCCICRRGFAGQSLVIVCPYCLMQLRERQALQDRLLAEKAAFERQMVVQREWIKLLQNGPLRKLPGGNALSSLGQLGAMGKLRRLERSIENRGRNNVRYLP